jgi:uncharacterized protein YfaS (alpha-2-macroglobulin family)
MSRLKAADRKRSRGPRSQSGLEVPGAAIALYDPDFNQFASGATDGSGLFKHQRPDTLDPNLATMAVVGDYGGTFGLAVSDWNAGIAPWDFGVFANYYASVYNAYLYTDKPIYRPGQTVHIKGIVRVEDDARYAIDRA